jgi:hypothetical protein
MPFGHCCGRPNAPARLANENPSTVWHCRVISLASLQTPVYGVTGLAACVPPPPMGVLTGGAGPPRVGGGGRSAGGGEIRLEAAEGDA